MGRGKWGGLGWRRQWGAEHGHGVMRRGRWGGCNGKKEMWKGEKGGGRLMVGGEEGARGWRISQMDMMKCPGGHMECFGGMRLQNFLTLFTRATPVFQLVIIIINIIIIIIIIIFINFSEVWSLMCTVGLLSLQFGKKKRKTTLHFPAKTSQQYCNLHHSAFHSIL